LEIGIYGSKTAIQSRKVEKTRVLEKNINMSLKIKIFHENRFLGYRIFRTKWEKKTATLKFEKNKVYICICVRKSLFVGRKNS